MQSSVIKSVLTVAGWSLLLLLGSCAKESPIVPINPNHGYSILDWLVPKADVIDSGVGKDGIPSVDNPQFGTPAEVNPAFDEDLVLGIEHQGEIRAYPVPMLDWHEIINDNVNGLTLAITYCPLTGSGIGWDRNIRGSLTTFGVSGLLYNTNLMPYDRRTNSTWSQMRLECVNGSFVGEKPKTYTLIETSFATWKKSFPNSKIMNANTGFDRRYSEYPYADYRTNQELLFFPVMPRDDRLPAKERVLGVLINERAKGYRFNGTAMGTEVIADEIDEVSIVVVRSKKDNYNTVFLNPENLTFEPVQDGLPRIMTDERGNAYDLAGRIISGPHQGQKLSQPLAFVSYWFSWGAFYPHIEIYEE